MSANLTPWYAVRWASRDVREVVGQGPACSSRRITVRTDQGADELSLGGQADKSLLHIAGTKVGDQCSENKDNFSAMSSACFAMLKASHAPADVGQACGAAQSAIGTEQPRLLLASKALARTARSVASGSAVCPEVTVRVSLLLGNLTAS